jgi:hypothetical protein
MTPMRSEGRYVEWVVWCPECHDVHPLSHLLYDDHQRWYDPTKKVPA